MIIRYFTRNVYGVYRFYIADQTLANLMHSKTLTASQIQAFKNLGCTVEEIRDPKSVQPN